MPELSEAARAARNEYARQWRRENPEKVEATVARFWERKAAERERQKKEVKNDE